SDGVTEAMSSMAVALAQEISRKQGQARLQMRNRQQAAIAKLGQRALGSVSLDELFQETAAMVAGVLFVEYAKVLELLPGGERLLLRAGVGWKENLVGTATVSAGPDSQAGYTLACKVPVIVDDLQSDTRFSGPPLLREHRGPAPLQRRRHPFHPRDRQHSRRGRSAPALGRRAAPLQPHADDSQPV